MGWQQRVAAAEKKQLLSVLTDPFSIQSMLPTHTCPYINFYVSLGFFLLQLYSEPMFYVYVSFVKLLPLFYILHIFIK